VCQFAPVVLPHQKGVSQRHGSNQGRKTDAISGLGIGKTYFALPPADQYNYELPSGDHLLLLTPSFGTSYRDGLYDAHSD